MIELATIALLGSAAKVGRMR